MKSLVICFLALANLAHAQNQAYSLTFRDVGGENVQLGYNASSQLQNEITNQSPDTVYVVFWGEFAFQTVARGPNTPSNQIQALPLGFFELPPGQAQNVSYNYFAFESFGYTAIHPDTQLDGGNYIAEPCVVVYVPQSTDVSDSVVGVNRLANTKGHEIEVDTDGCVSNFQECSVQCTDAGVTDCASPQGPSALVNCNQPNADTNPTLSQTSGGCFIRSPFFKTTFGGAA